MALQLMMLDYEQLVEMELLRATLCDEDQTRARHLNRAAAYAYHSEKAKAGQSQKTEVLTLIANLSMSLDEADRIGLADSALYINAAIIELGGIGVPPPDQYRQG